MIQVKEKLLFPQKSRSPNLPPNLLSSLRQFSSSALGASLIYTLFYEGLEAPASFNHEDKPAVSACPYTVKFSTYFLITQARASPWERSPQACKHSVQQGL